MSWQRFLTYNDRRRPLGRTLDPLGYLAGTHIVTAYTTIGHYQ
jgi:hypothetical protein